MSPWVMTEAWERHRETEGDTDRETDRDREGETDRVREKKKEKEGEVPYEMNLKLRDLKVHCKENTSHKMECIHWMLRTKQMNYFIC